MTRHDKLYSMKMADLAEVAENLGIKINKKGAKSEAVAKILEAEAEAEKAETAKVEEPKRLQEIRKQRNEAENSLLKAKEEVFSDILDDVHVAEVMEQKKELGIEVPTITEAPKLVPMPGTEDPNWGEKHCGLDTVDQTLLVKFTKKEQRIITSIYRDGTRYHVTIEKNGDKQFFHDKSLLRIGLAIRKIVKGE